MSDTPKRCLHEDFDAARAAPAAPKKARTTSNFATLMASSDPADFVDDWKTAAFAYHAASIRYKNAIMEQESTLRECIIDRLSVDHTIFSYSSSLYVMPRPSPGFLSFKEFTLAVQFLSDNGKKNICIETSMGSSFSSLDFSFLIFALMDEDKSIVDCTRWLFQYLALVQLRNWRLTGNLSTVLHLPDVPLPEYIAAAVLLGHQTASQMAALAYALLYGSGYISAVLHLHRETAPYIAKVFSLTKDPNGTKLNWNESTSTGQRETLTIDLCPVVPHIDLPNANENGPNPAEWRCACCGSDTHQSPPPLERVFPSSE